MFSISHQRLYVLKVIYFSLILKYIFLSKSLSKAMNMLIVQFLLSYIRYFIKFSEKRCLLDPIEEFMFRRTGGNAQFQRLPMRWWHLR